MITILDALTPPNSELYVFSPVSIDVRLKSLQSRGIDANKDWSNIRVVHQLGNPTIRRQLNDLPMQTFDSTMILGSIDESDTMFSDSQV